MGGFITLNRNPFAKPKNYTPIEEAPEVEEESFDYNLAESPTAVKKPVLGEYSGFEAIKNKANNYNAVSGNNGADYASQYLASGDKTRLATPEEMNTQKETLTTSPVVNQDNEVVKSAVTRAVPEETQQAVNTDEQSNADWMNEQFQQYMQSAPEYVTEEDEAKRLRASMSKKTVADLGSLASAFANLYFTGKGANNQTVAYADKPNYQAYVDRWQAGRNAYNNYVQKGREYIRRTALEDMDRKYKTIKMDLDNQYRQAQIDYQTARTTAQQEKAALEMQKVLNQQSNADRNYQLAVDRLNETRRHNQQNEATSAYRASISASREARMASGGSGGSGGGSKSKVYMGGNRSYTMPSNMNKKQVDNAIDAELGISKTKQVDDTSKVIGYKNGKYIYGKKTVNKSEAELQAERNKLWNDNCDAIVRNFGGSVANGNVVTQPTQTPSDVFVGPDGKKYATKEEWEKATKDYYNKNGHVDEKKPKVDEQKKKASQSAATQVKKGTEKKVSTSSSSGTSSSSSVSGGNLFNFGNLKNMKK